MLGDVNWLAFLLAMAVVELTPGPNMGWLTALAAQQGRKVGFMAVAGITLGLGVQLLLAVTGLSTILSGNRLIYEVIRWAGILFMLYLAWEAFADKGETSPGQADQLAGFRRGFIANLLNPKALVFYIAIVSQFASHAGGTSAITVLVLGCIHILISLLVHAGLVMLGSSIGDRVAQWQQSLALRTVFALALVGIAIWIAASTA